MARGLINTSIIYNFHIIHTGVILIFTIIEEAFNSVDLTASSQLLQMRGQNRVISLFSMKNGVLEESSQNFASGVGIRVLSNGTWGFSSTNILNQKSIQQTVENAQKLAQTAAHYKAKTITLPELPPIIDSVCGPCQKSVEEITPDEIVKILEEISTGLEKSLPELISTKINLLTLKDNKIFLSSEGSRIHEEFTKIQLKIDLLLKKHDLIIPFSETYGHTGGMELFDKKYPTHIAESLSSDAKRLLGAKACPAGVFEVVIQPSLCATLLHEAIGHPLEADLAMAGGGFNEGLMGQKVSSELITIYDSGIVEGGLGYFAYDDEGVKCIPTMLIEDGILTSYMHDRTSAAIAEVEPTGNAHAWAFDTIPLIRQTNIGIKAGDSTTEELIEEIKDGFVLEGTFGGMADSNGDFTFGFQKAYAIKQGKLAQLHLGANVSGNAIEVFKTITGVGNESILRPGACGKGQFAIQGRIVPAIRCEIMVGGKGGT